MKCQTVSPDKSASKLIFSDHGVDVNYVNPEMKLSDSSGRLDRGRRQRKSRDCWKNMSAAEHDGFIEWVTVATIQKISASRAENSWFSSISRIRN